MSNQQKNRLFLSFSYRIDAALTFIIDLKFFFGKINIEIQALHFINVFKVIEWFKFFLPFRAVKIKVQIALSLQCE